MNAGFLGNLPREARILEVGGNTGMQLVGLQAAGFSNLYGIERQPYAVEQARELVHGVPIHSVPEDLPHSMDYEYCAPETTPIKYRGNTGFLGKTDFAQVFLDNFPNLRLTKQRRHPRINDAEQGNQDVVYLLKKNS